MVEITDEMVWRMYATQDSSAQGLSLACCRRLLTAALNPPAEPEIVVTEEMKKAAHAAWYHSWHGDAATDYDERGSLAIYRAMRRLEPSGKSAPWSLPWFNRMCLPGAVIPATDPRVSDRRGPEPDDRFGRWLRRSGGWTLNQRWSSDRRK